MTFKQEQKRLIQSVGQRKALDLVRGGASRRDVMKWALAMGLSMSAASSLFGTAVLADEGTPKRGGRIKVAFVSAGPNDTLDPHIGVTAVDYFRHRMLYNSLVRLTPQLGWEPELATEVLPNADATEWTIKLRDGIEFHDGKTFGADDVVYSLRRHIGPDSISKSASLVGAVTDVSKVNANEVKVTLSSPDVDLPLILGTYHFRIVQDGATDFLSPVGTGPFKLVEFRPGVRMIGVRNENYFGDGPYLDEIETFGINDNVARLNALMSGDIDLMIRLPFSSIETVKNTEGLDVWSVKSGSYPEVVARRDLDPFGTPHLIKTMQYLLDRDRIERGVFKGFGAKGNDQPISPAYAEHCADIPQRDMDPDKAKWHYDQTGLGKVPIPIFTADAYPAAVDQCTIIQREGAKLGIDFQIQKVVTDGYWSNIWGKEPIFMGAFNMRPTANIMLTLTYQSQAAWNTGRWQNEQFDQLLVAARGELDPVKRQQMNCDLQTMIYETGASVISGHPDYVDGAKSVVKGLRPVPLGDLGGSECPEFLWRTDV